MGDWPVREDKDSGFDCEVCRNFADNCGGSASEREPFHPDCFIHQYVKRRCMIRLSVSGDIKRCEMRYGHGGPCLPVGTATDIIPEQWPVLPPKVGSQNRLGDAR